LAAGVLAISLMPVSAFAQDDGRRGVTITLVADANGLQVVDGPGGGTRVLTTARPRGDRPYVGVHVSPVPAAVASQLCLTGGGVMIRNVAKDSPADKAGVEQFDVIVEMSNNEESVPVKSVEQFIDAVAGCKDGQKLTLKVIRGGKQRPIELTLGKPPAGPIVYKYADEPDDLVNNELRVSRGLLRMKDGKWVLEGPEGSSVELPGDVFKALPRGPMARMLVQSQVVGDPNGPHEVTVTSMIDGRELAFKKLADGKIEVRRKGPDGKAETKTYDSVQQLKEKDAEAYNLYEQALKGRIHIKIGPGQKLSEGAAKAAEQLQKQLDQNARKLSEEAQGHIRQAGADARPPRRKFEVDDQGRIQVQIIQDDGELNISFANEAEMKQKNPKLYEQYKKLLEDVGGK